MSYELRNQKDALAKLMATENLTIVHRKVPTAYFDIKNRVLCCPIMKDDLSPYLYDLFMGHEVGHALHTPLEGLHSTLKENRTLKGYLNVIEDVRIERKIKDKFAGLRKSFYSAYNELMQKDFFGLKGRNLQDLSLIDKINLITKVGSRVNIQLTDEEQVFLDKALAVDTWEDVVAVAQEIYDWSKENETRDENDESINKNYEYDIVEDDEDEEDYSETDGTDSDDEEEDDDIEDYFDDPYDETDSDSDNEEETKPLDTKMQGQGGGQYDDEDGARESLTEYHAHNNEEQFVSDDNKIIHQKDLRPAFKQDWIAKGEYKVSYKVVLEDFKKFWFDPTVGTSYYYGNEYDFADALRLAETTAKKIENKNKRIVNHMAKEFDMKQTAKRSAKAFTGRTGQLDMNRLAKYQIVDDIFKRAVYLPDGKNHGINILLDWSGSISKQLPDLLEQTFILTMFCRKVQIPHRVYFFTDNYGREFNRTGKLVELFTNEMSNRDFKKMMVNMSTIWNAHSFSESNWRGIDKFKKQWFDWFQEEFKCSDYGYVYAPNYVPGNYHLGGTPLDSSIIYMRKEIPEFNKKYGIEKSILTVITDGESHSSKFLELDKFDEEIRKQQLDHVDADDHMRRWPDEKHQLIDPYNGRVFDTQVSRYNYAFERTQNLLHWVSETTGAIITGYFVLNRKHDAYWIIEKVGSKDDLNDAWAEIRKTGKVFNCHGYNKLFITTISNLSAEGDDQLDDSLIDATRGRLKQAFLKNQRSKITSRFLTSEFIKEIA